MIDLRALARYRIVDFPGNPPNWHPDAERFGAFAVPSCIDRSPLMVIVSNDLGWDHVSVSRKTRCPNWPEMSQIKDLFFDPGETAMQLHPPRDAWISNHPYCLHLWRPHESIGRIPMPPPIFVGVRDAGELRNAEHATKAMRTMLAGRTIEDVLIEVEAEQMQAAGDARDVAE